MNLEITIEELSLPAADNAASFDSELGSVIHDHLDPAASNLFKTSNVLAAVKAHVVSSFQCIASEVNGSTKRID